MEKRKIYVVLGIGLILTCLTAYGAFAYLQGPYIGGWIFAEQAASGCYDLMGNCQQEKIRLACPLMLLGNQSKTVTVSISNPEDTEHKYHTNVTAIILEQGEYREEVVCSGLHIVVPPKQKGSITCELHPKSTKGQMMWLYTHARSTDKKCGGIIANCGVQSQYWLYCLVPFLVATPFVWWFFKKT